MPRPLRVATRGSELARWQADRVATLLGDDAELVIVTTTGDVADRRAHPRDRRHRRLREGGAAGRARRPRRRRGALGQGSPRRRPPDGLVLAAVPERADPRDVLVGSTLDALPAGGARRHRVGAAPRAARRPATRSHVRRAARQHPHPARPRRRVRRHRGRGGRARAPRPSTDAAAEYLEPSVHAAPGRPGRARGRVPHRRRRDPRAACRDRRHARARRGRRRARVPRRARRRLRPAVRRARDGRRRRRGRARGAARRARRPHRAAHAASRGSDPVDVGRDGARATCSTARRPRRCSTTSCRGTRPGRR